MLNKDIFISKCQQRGFTKEAAEKLYNKEMEKKAAEEFEYMKKAAFDLGFNDAMRLFKIMEERQTRSE